jgi:hypothetical protein
MKGVSRRPRTARVAGFVLAGVTALLAAQVSPAAAKPQLNKQASSFCNSWATAGSSTFAPLSRLIPATSAARGGEKSRRNDPAPRSGMFRGTESSQNGDKHDNNSNTDWSGAKVKVYYHVVTDGAAGQLTNAQLDAQTNVLNITYAGRTSGSPMLRTGSNTEFRFVTAGVDRTNNPAWYAQATASTTGEDEIAMKQALKRGGPTDLDVYTTSGGDYLGWAYYPDIVTDPVYSFLDGIVIDYRSMPGPEAYRNYGLGYTLTHEAGHWLGLAHTFNEDGTCNPPGDFVNDTPYELTPTNGCPVGKDTCPAPGYDPIHNYMDYSYDPCYNQFTDGQSERMADQYTFWRVHKGKTKGSSNNH